MLLSYRCLQVWPSQAVTQACDLILLVDALTEASACPHRGIACPTLQCCCYACSTIVMVVFLCRSYQNELRQRVSANSLKPVNYIDESRLLIAQIEKLAVAA